MGRLLQLVLPLDSQLVQLQPHVQILSTNRLSNFHLAHASQFSPLKFMGLRQYIFDFLQLLHILHEFILHDAHDRITVLYDGHSQLQGVHLHLRFGHRDGVQRFRSDDGYQVV